jgi:hypothetical protein
MGERMNFHSQRVTRVRSLAGSLRRRARDARRVMVMSSLLSAALLGGWAAIASQASLAAGTYKLESSFGAPGGGTGEFEEPGSVAVEASTGDVFVIDTEGNRVEKFEPAHEPGKYEAVGAITAAGSEPFEFKDHPGIAVDNSSGAYAGDVYVVSGKPKKQSVYQLRPKSGHPNEYEASGTRLEGFAKEKVHGVAVGANGYVYVAYGTSVSVFSPTGELESALSGAASEVQGIAVSGSAMYLATVGGLERWALNGSYEVEQRTMIDTAPTGSAYEAVAIDGKGRVYVDVVYAKEEGKSVVAMFAADAGANSSPIEEFGGNGVVQVSAGLAYGAPAGVPSLLVGDTTDDEVHVFQHTSPEVTGCDAEPTIGSAAVACTLTPDALQATWKLEYQAPLEGFVEALNGTASGEGEVGGELVGLEPAEAYTYRLEAKSSGGATAVEGQFETLPVPPIAAVSTASTVLSSTATLNGTVDPVHSATFYRFEYGACTVAESCAASPFPDEAPESTAGSSRGASAVSAIVRELQPTTTYHYRVVAINAGGKTVSGEQIFTTVASSQAEAQTGSASDVSQTGASLSGTIDPNGQTTTFIWEVGTTTSYGLAFYRSMGAETVPESVSVALTALLPDTTYHYRLVATNESGTAYGANQTFTTLAYGGAPFTMPTPLALLPVYQQSSSSPTGAVLPSREVKPTRAQLLAKALKACKQHKPKSKRVACERQARKKYGTKSTAKK